jgi:hypothetical protein
MDDKLDKLLRILREVQHDFEVRADSGDRITTEINLAVASAIELIAHHLHQQ